MLDHFLQWFRRVFSIKSGQVGKSSTASKPPITFSNITLAERTPRNHEVKPGFFYLVGSGSKLKWAMFLCPCGCGHVITLSLQNIHNPHWQLNVEVEGRPSLHPSVWQKTECFSHFWLREGCIYWCEGTGAPSN